MEFFMKSRIINNFKYMNRTIIIFTIFIGGYSHSNETCENLFSSSEMPFIQHIVVHGALYVEKGPSPPHPISVLRLSKTWDPQNYTFIPSAARVENLTSEDGQPLVSKLDVYRRKSIGLIFDKYGKAVSKELSELIKRTEDNLPANRTISIIVEKNEEVKGLLRVFDGTSQSRLSSFPNKTPAEIIFSERGITIHSIENERKLNPNVDIYEIGKFWVSNHEERVADRIAAKLLVLESLYSISFQSTDQSNPIFFVHVVTKAHRKIYESEYGFKVLETVLVDGKTEYLMKTDFIDLRTKLAQDIAKLKEQHRSTMNQ
jgi:hypothetical protein